MRETFLEEKVNRLKYILKEMKAVCVAFSGGVDSTFLLAVAKETLGENVFAVNISGKNFAKFERDFAKSFCENLGVDLIDVDKEDEILKAISTNGADRCYQCKKVIFQGIEEEIKRKIELQNKSFPIFEEIEDENQRISNNKNSMSKKIHIIDGSNYDDIKDYRPGRKATKELGVRSPLEEACLTKNEIREVLKERGIEIWNKPAFSCLATRIPTGEEVTIEKLSQIETCENYLRELGFNQIRVRHHGDVARIEIDLKDFERFNSSENRTFIDENFRELGFKFVTLDLGGYKMGNMN